MTEHPLSRTSLIISCLGILIIYALILPPPGEPRGRPGKRTKGGSVQVHLARGEKLFQKGKYGGAIRHFSRAIRVDNHSARAYALRGKAYDQIGRPNKAIADYSRYIELNPRDYRGYVLRGDTFNFNYMHEKALQDYQTALRLKPDSHSALMGRGLAYAALGKYREAIRDYLHLLKRGEGNAELIGNLGVAFMRSGDSVSALKCFDRALELEKNRSWKKKMEAWVEKLLEDPKVRQSGLATGRLHTRFHPSRSLW